MALEAFSGAGSSNIGNVTFDGATDTLTVEFTSGDVYDYFNVPRSVFLAFKQAGSFGQFFGRQIKGRYAYERQ